MTKFLIVGLGNPGREYAFNRHNVGFMAVDRLAKKHGTAFTRRQGKALITTLNVDAHPLVLAKPQTFMNLSGDAVASLLHFYDVPLENFLVCFDDLDLPVGTIRLRPQGGSAGQNGVQSIIEKLGTQNFPRLRLGIGRPPGRMLAAAYVLRDFDKFDGEVMNLTLDKAVEAIEVFVNEGLNAAMNKFNGTADGE
ncbi:MAG: aminoacyl-tRNA hydrolase [Chloroflexi bacterium]|nr:aminoacyl-tRNA hydrolase [Chloroflexota bacterium]MBI5711898.1 aminoacyl-tRNA hydrolase [Chloroflexota bacterium]